MKTVTWTRLNGEKVVSHVTPHISYMDVCAMAVAIKDKVFEGGVYRPYRRELDFVWQTLANYTDIQFEDVNEMMEEYQYGSLRKAISSVIDTEQLAKVAALADDMIEYERNKGGMDRLGALLTGLIAQSLQAAETQTNEVE